MNNLTFTFTAPNRSYIYALVDPLAPETIRYIGCSENLEARYNAHLSDISNQRKYQWIDDLRKRDGSKPKMIILEMVATEIGPDRENYWINTYKSTHLLNRNVPACDTSRLTLKQRVERLEFKLIDRAIKLFKGNMQSTAKYLGISRPTLYERMSKLRISNPRD